MRILLLTVGTVLFSLSATAQIEWLSWEEATERQQQKPKKLLVDVYTDWCGWCKQMDKKVFAQPAIAEYISEHFYAVKLNAEQRDDIEYAGHTFVFDPSLTRRGAHTLAVSLLDGKLSFPSIVYLDEETKRITVSPGFKPADNFIHELTYIAGGHYRTMDYREYLKTSAK
jgi:thioredoxin-related protein